MISRINLLIYRLVNLLLICGLAVFASAQKSPDKCPSADKHQPQIKYQIGKSVPSAEGPPSLLIHISIKPKNFNREDMLTLAHQLNRDFCNEQIIAILIFDSHSSAKSFAPHPHSKTYDRDMKSLRGSYYLNRTNGQEILRFSSAPGKPRDETNVDLGTTPSP